MQFLYVYILSLDMSEVLKSSVKSTFIDELAAMIVGAFLGD